MLTDPLKIDSTIGNNFLSLLLKAYRNPSVLSPLRRKYKRLVVILYTIPDVSGNDLPRLFGAFHIVK